MPLTKIKSLGITDGTIVNADINASAAIVSTKLSGVQGKFESALLHVRDEKSANTGGGTFTSGSFVTRTLNTVVTNEISGASLTSNQIILPSGTYFIEAFCSAEYVDGHKAKLRNITDSSDTVIGRTARASSSSVNSTTSHVIGRFTITAQKHLNYNIVAKLLMGQVLEIQVNFSLTEVYAIAMIWKVA